MEGLFDIHCHIIPEVDDGARSMAEALKMLELEYEEGVRTIIVTPHYRRGMFETPWERIKSQFELLKREAGRTGCGIDLYLGCEFHSNMEMVQTLKANPQKTMAGSKYVLTEFSGADHWGYIRERISALVMGGYKPVIAHVERYPCLRKSLSLIEELVEIGAYVQVNAGSITGEGGFSAKGFCKKLMKARLIHFVGTDAHGVRRRQPKIKEAYSYIAKKMGTRYAQKIFVMNPQRIIM